MTEPDLQYCGHALARMSRAGISADEVYGIVRHPAWRRPSYAQRIEHHGYSDDGRHLRIVVEADESTVVTVVVEPFR